MKVKKGVRALYRCTDYDTRADNGDTLPLRYVPSNSLLCTFQARRNCYLGVTRVLFRCYSGVIQSVFKRYSSAIPVLSKYQDCAKHLPFYVQNSFKRGFTIPTIISSC